MVYRNELCPKVEKAWLIFTLVDFENASPSVHPSIMLEGATQTMMAGGTWNRLV